jgi:hypothetical protein
VQSLAELKFMRFGSGMLGGRKREVEELEIDGRILGFRHLD